LHLRRREPLGNGRSPRLAQPTGAGEAPCCRGNPPGAGTVQWDGTACRSHHGEADVRALVPLLFAALLSPAFASDGRAQTPTPGQLRVFLDCPTCDFDFVRTEVPWVDWMRDRADAQVHVLVTSRPTGGGGREFTLDLIGLRDFAGRADTLRYVADRDNSADDTRRGLTRTLKLGLVGYAARTAVGPRLQIDVAAVPGRQAAVASPAHDPWNHWTFSIGGSGFFDGESTGSGFNASSNVTANRVTDAWKIELRVNGSYRERSFTYFNPAIERDTTVVSVFRNYGGNALIARSINGQLSIGGRAALTTSTFGNTRLSVSVAPAIEYNVFPYAQSTRRSFTFQYAPGVLAQEYRETTIFLQDEETRLQHAATVAYATRQPWGNINLSVYGSQFLHDTNLYQVTFFGGSSVNILRGLRANFFGNYQMIRDQIALPLRDATPEEVLLRQRQLRTNFRYFANVGLSYRFGSRVQNVVNPRFASTGGNVMIFDGF
jgi:hypothetical protein